MFPPKIPCGPKIVEVGGWIAVYQKKKKKYPQMKKLCAC